MTGWDSSAVSVLIGVVVGHVAARLTIRALDAEVSGYRWWLAERAAFLRGCIGEATTDADEMPPRGCTNHTAGSTK